jgi:polyisoprenoid-binding protein YceI
MALPHSARTALSSIFAFGLFMAAAHASVSEPNTYNGPLAIGSGRITIAGTSNIHEYTASTTVINVTRVQLAAGLAGPNFLSDIARPGALEFEIAVPAASLSSPKEGLDKNMYKALKVAEHQNITFKLRRLEARTGASGALRGVGLLQIAGVEREIAIDLTTTRRDDTLAVHGEVLILMTDYGITPPKAMLGMLKTDPKVTVTFDTVLTIPLT